jgi:predicted adenylyl cyclase CyaB
MGRNIEIKAYLRDRRSVERAAQGMATEAPRALHQRDTFFPCSTGRLKLRELSEDRGELIHYERPDAAGPKASRYSIVETDRPAQLCRTLSDALGALVTVTKTRTLYMAGRTRIHLDEVDRLGAFVELEVVLAEGERPDDAREEAERLMDALGIDEADLVQGAYADMLMGRIREPRAGE